MKTLGLIVVVTGGLTVASAMAANGNTGPATMTDVVSAMPSTTFQLAQNSATPASPGLRVNPVEPPKPGGLAPTPTPSRPGLAPNPTPFRPGLAPNPTPSRPGFTAPTSDGPTHTGTGGFQAAPTMSCAAGFSKTRSQVGAKGYVDYMDCQGPVIKCPAPSKNVGQLGVPKSVGIEVEKVNVPVGNESNHFRIKYVCTYYSTEG